MNLAYYIFGIKSKYWLSVIFSMPFFFFLFYSSFKTIIWQIKVKDMYTPNDEGAFTIFCEAANGEKINVRVDGDAQPKFKHSEIEVGKTYDVIGGVSKYNDSYQLMLANCKGEAVNDFKLSE